MIRKLVPHLVHQIAAGEVVERPASALKELIENSLDAGASKISIEFEGGGLQRLSIEDDGCGIPAEELPLAFEAHATSKLSEMEDFQRLSSFGFRGEALCSLASVADLEIWTATREVQTGAMGRVSYGVAEDIKTVDRRIGTRVLVKNIFSRHPARLKFMKSERAEAQGLQQVFRRYALAKPEVNWVFRDLKKPDAETRLSAQSRFDRVLWFFDSAHPEQWFLSVLENELWKVEVVALRPAYLGRAKSGLQFFLNDRPFKDSKMEFAVRRGFEGFTLMPREISAAVFVEGSPELFDVNVHPMKSEVRFTDPDALFSLIVKAVRAELEKEHRSPLVDFTAPAVISETPAEVPSWSVTPSAEPAFEMGRPSPHPALAFAPETSRTSFEARPLMPMFAENLSTTGFRYLGSLDDTYLIVQRGPELYLFDQHALHERILYEKFLKAFRSHEQIPSQRLLFPVPVQLPDAEVLLEQEEILEHLGFELRLWNDGKIQIIAAPAILKRDYASVLSKLSDCLELPIETMAKEVLSTMACHSAVRAHDRIERAEIEKLLSDFQSEDALGHCPHGRPTFVRFQIKDFEKFFHRVV